jgi:two-component system, cell cycle response regulator
MVASSLEEIVSCQQLPSLPTVAVQVIELSADPTVQIPAIAEVIQNDQALTAKILKTVNSSFYGLTDPCETISRAMTYLGLNTIKSLVLGFSLVRLGRGEHGSDALLKHWRRTVCSAAASRWLAQELGNCDPEEAFICALMQDIGSLAMHTVMREAYAQLVEEAGYDHFRLPLIERRELGFDHAAVGAMLGERWRLPGSLVEIIKHHHNPQHASHHQLLQTITLGTQVAEIIGAAGSEPDCQTMLERFTWCGANWYNINPLATGELVRRISNDAAELAEQLEINIGNPPDTDAIMARAEEVSLMHQLRVQQETERLRQQNSALSRMARTCGLTGLVNRRWFDEELHARVQHATTTNTSLAVIFIDVDHFKRLNDSLGHQAGDVALIEMANRISSCLPEDGVACRYGGEEFVVMLPGMGRSDAARVAERIRAKISESAVDLHDAGCEQSSVALTVSAGVAAIEERTSGVLTNSILLIKAADRALYHAKLSGRNQVQIFVPRQQHQVPGAK